MSIILNLFIYTVYYFVQDGVNKVTIIIYYYYCLINFIQGTFKLRQVNILKMANLQEKYFGIKEDKN